jgi:predicted Mrr-cat superfamily restriction endonuclease
MNPDTLKMTTLDLRTRQPLRVTVKDGEQLRTDQVISDLMGKDVAARFKMITENAADIRRARRVSRRFGTATGLGPHVLIARSSLLTRVRFAGG